MRAVDSGEHLGKWEPLTGQWNATTGERTEIEIRFEIRFEIRLRFALNSMKFEFDMVRFDSP